MSSLSHVLVKSIEIFIILRITGEPLFGNAVGDLVFTEDHSTYDSHDERRVANTANATENGLTSQSADLGQLLAAAMGNHQLLPNVGAVINGDDDDDDDDDMYVESDDDEDDDDDEQSNGDESSDGELDE
jgi:hypothetical protein